MRPILAFLLLIVAAAAGHAVDTMPKMFDEIRDRTGTALSGARVQVTLTGTGTLATLYADDEVTTKTNPLTTDSHGAFQFKAAGGQAYDLTVTWNGQVVDVRSHIPMGSLSATVSSVALAMPAEFSVAGSPITTAGTITVTEATETANTVYAGPTTGAAAAPGFRAIVPADLTAALLIPPAIGTTTPAAGKFTSVIGTSVTDSGLTSGRIPYASTGGLLADAAGLTFNGTTLVVPNLTNSSLTSGRVPYAGTAGLMSDDSAFTRGTLTFGVDPSADATASFGYGKLGLATSGTSTAFYIAQVGNYNSTDYMLRQTSAGGTTVNAKTGTNVILSIANTAKLTLTSSSATLASGVPLTLSDSTASTTTGTGALIVAGGAGVAGALNAGSATFGAALPIASGGTAATSASAARTSLGVAVDQWNVMIEAPTAKTYTICFQSEVAYTINEVICATTSGTCTLAFKINGTNITGLSAVAVTSTPATTSATAANALSSGQTLTVLASSISSPVDLTFTVKGTR